MIQKTVLDNGIRVISEKMPGAHSTTIGVWVLNGSRHENPEQNGISHFAEHMLFKGTERRSARDIALEIDSVGGVLNAFTSREHCCFYAKVLAEKTPLAIDILSDVILNSVFNLDEIEKERRVILQEIHMLEDSPEETVHDQFSEAFWSGHPLGMPVQGSLETVRNLSREMLLEHVNDCYRGGDLLVCAAGALDHDDLVAKLSIAFGDLAGGSLSAPCSPPKAHRGIEVVEKDLEQVQICLGTLALPQNHPQRFEAYLLNTILGGSMSCRLFQSIREEQGLAYSIYSYLSNYVDTGSLVVYCATGPENVPLAISLILDELRRIKNEPVPMAELQSAKDQLKGSLLLSLESTDSRMTRLAKNEMYFGHNPMLDEVLAGFDSVTQEGLRSLANTIMQDDYLNLQMIGDIEKHEFPLLDLTLG